MAMNLGTSRGLNSGINVTPLVDVVLVLLIIFMVVTPMLGPSRSAVPPSTENPSKMQDDGHRILVVIDDRHRISIGRDDVSEEMFPQRMRESFERDSGSTVAIKADAALTYGDVKKSMLEIHRAGYTQMALIAQKTAKRG